MPGSKYNSIQNPRMYEALRRRRGLSKRSATRISNAQTPGHTVKGSAVADLAIPPHGPNALFNQPSMAQRRQKKRHKDAAPPAATGQPGEHLGPGVTRIRGNLCNVHGRYGPCESGKNKRRVAQRRATRTPKPKKTPEQRAAERNAEYAANRQRVLSGFTITSEDQSALEALRRDEQPDVNVGTWRNFENDGLIERAQDGSYHLTASGRAMLSAADHGDAGRTGAIIAAARDRLAARRARAARAVGRRGRRRNPIVQAMEGLMGRATKAQSTFGGKKRGNLPDSAFAGPDRSFPIMTAQDVRDAVRSLGRTKHDKDVVKRDIIRRARAIGAMDALPESWRTEKAFAVFKDARGIDRWASITTTAYQDKDGEWIGCKAIAGVVKAADAGAPRGPLRFWHVPGLDLGDCDYQATAFDDRFLIESGTFRSSAAARIGQKAAARGYQMSPGFLHTRTEPQRGLYEHIALFERSFVPPGRASNPHTRLLTKGDRMLTDEKRKEFEALAGDAEGRALLEGLLAQATATVKANDAAGAVYKDAPPWAQALVGRLDAMEERLKAFPLAAAATDEAVAAAADDDLAALDTEAAAADEGDGDDMDDEAFAAMLSDRIVRAIAPLFDIEKKMRGMVDELKGTLTPIATKDDERAKQLEGIDARLKELEGTQPRAHTSLAGGVWGALPGLTMTKEQAAQLGATPVGNEAPAGLTNPVEIAAHKALWGNS